MANHHTPLAPEREGLVRSPHRESHTLSADAGADLHPVVTLQRQIGNAQIQRLLAQREAVPEEDELQAKRDHSAVQREAAPEEDELQAKRDESTVQRASNEEEEEQPVQGKHDSTLQREAAPVVGPEGGPVSEGIAGQIRSKQGGGAPLDDGTRATMERSFGDSFDEVRIHRDGESDSLNRSLGAKAFTTGSDIFFRKDASPTDHSLLGHELTHVVQQRTGAVGGGGEMRVGPANDSFEQAADSAGSTAASGGVVAQPKRDGE